MPKNILRGVLLALVVIAGCGLSNAATLPILLSFSPAGGTFTIDNTTNRLTLSSGTGVSLTEATLGPALSTYGGINNLVLSFTNPAVSYFSIGTISNNTASLSGTGTMTLSEVSGGGAITMDMELIDIAYNNATLTFNAKPIFNLSNPQNFTQNSVPIHSGTQTLLTLLSQNAPAYITFSKNIGGLGTLSNALQVLSGSPYTYTASLYVTPEPSFYGLLAVGMGGLLFFARRRKAQ